MHTHTNTIHMFLISDIFHISFQCHSMGHIFLGPSNTEVDKSKSAFSYILNSYGDRLVSCHTVGEQKLV